MRRRMRDMGELNPFNFVRQAMERTFQDPRQANKPQSNKHDADDK